MAYRVLEVNLISANDLKKVTLFSRLRVYAIASISGGDPRIPTHSTLADYVNGCNPAWNTTAHFPIPEAADTRGLALHVRLRAKRAYFGDRDVGEVYVPVDDLLAGADKGGDPRPVSYQVRRPHSGRAHGVLYFCYKFTDVPAAGLPEPEAKQGQYAKYVQDSEMSKDKTMSPPPTAYPPPQVMSAYPPTQAMPAYPPPQAMPGYPPAQYGYGSPYAAYPPQQPYGYAAPPPYGYNAAPQQPPPMYGYAAAPARQSGGMGMGLGLGLLGGAVGGMMLGEMVGDYEADAAYDSGFNDALEF
ncbi:hypothetical protein SETIT_5G168100v2 [Setaria italica]|uniref:C2 domain-containing protein n=1 Tax=Setaria italica TaxID=4555 RepID=A0A368R5I0_SETIT|nr:protein SRC2 [Setaria italica]RCV25455.1 hypothetical protein SETIT_5G168100v2 [Setaria italica]